MASMPALPNATAVRESAPPSEQPRADVRAKTAEGRARMREAGERVMVTYAPILAELAK